MLHALGFNHVDIAKDGIQASDLAKQHPDKYDLVLMDIQMPLLDGLGATKLIRKEGIAAPIIAMTANALKGDAGTYMANGVDDYVPKPVDRQLLLNVLSRWLELGK